MAASESSENGTAQLTITQRDILFECPACGKNLVVDQSAEGLIVDCPQCHTSVIVPPKPDTPPRSPSDLVSNTVAKDTGRVDGDELRSRMNTIAGKLRELQTQRTEINNRLASRMNDINRDLVLMARLETAQQQVISELNQIVTQIGTTSNAASLAKGRTRVNLRS
jgi:Zn finger protein HypA/HybF involved in hydrogenase expression